MPHPSTWRVLRPGFTMLVSMILLTIITALAVVWAKRVVLQHRLASQRIQAMQSEFLAASGVQRALSQLAANPSYREETWTLLPADLQGEYGATIEIQIHRSQADDVREIEVLVDYPNDLLLRQRVRRVQQLIGPFTEKSS